MRASSKLFAVLALASAMAAGVTAQKVQINGAGATFPYVIYSKWFSEYNKLHPNIEINYQSQGSGAGIRQLSNQTVCWPLRERSCTSRPCSAPTCLCTTSRA